MVCFELNSPAAWKVRFRLSRSQKKDIGRMRSFNNDPCVLFSGALLAIAIGLSASSALAGGGAPIDGHRLAQKLCSNCHDVGPSGASGRALPAPSFRAIANRAGQTAVALAGSIIMPHPDMPNVPLTRAEVRSLVAYIGSLNAAGRLPMSEPVLPSPPPKRRPE